METGPHIAVLMKRLKKCFLLPNPYILSFDYIHNLNVLLLSVLPAVVQNAKAESKGLISSKL